MIYEPETQVLITNIKRLRFFTQEISMANNSNNNKYIGNFQYTLQAIRDTLAYMEAQVEFGIKEKRNDNK